jgi:hypothetical protein
MITDGVAGIECLGCPSFYNHTYNRLMVRSYLTSGHMHMHFHVGIVGIFINVCNASRICSGRSSFLQEFSKVQVFVGLPLKLADTMIMLHFSSLVVE